MNLSDKTINQNPSTDRDVIQQDQPSFKIDISSHLTKLSPNHLRREKSATNRLLLKKKSTSQDINPQSLSSSRLKIQTSSSPVRANVTSSQGFTSTSAKDIPDKFFANLYDKIMSQTSQHSATGISSNVETPLITPRIMLQTSGSQRKLETPNLKHIRQKTLERINTPSSPIKSDIRALSRKGSEPVESIRIGRSTSDINTTGEDRYKFIRMDSKFVEITGLKSKNDNLAKQNRQLKQDIVEMNDFGEVFKSKFRNEDFNEKRCDVLKFCIKKQKSQISYMSKAVRLCHTFSKDMQNVLAFLIDMNEKYIKSKTKVDKTTADTLKKYQTEGSMANSGLLEIYKELGNTETVRRYLNNFNEAYSQIKEVYEEKLEMQRLFKIKGNDPALDDVTVPKLDQEPSGKLKYNYVLKQFIDKYQKIFPLYTVFNDFELKDQQDFSVFLEQIISMSNKINYNFSRLKNLNFLEKTAFIAKDDTPEILKKNREEFKEYFNSKNPNKRIFLDSDEIFRTEKSLSSLLNDLVKLHSALANKKDISLDNLSKVQDSVRSNVEHLLLLGVTVNNDNSTDDKVFVVGKRSSALRGSQILQHGAFSENKVLFEIYNHESRNITNFNESNVSIKEILSKGLKQSEQTASKEAAQLFEEISVKIRHLERNYEEITLIGRLKDSELRFLRSYTQNSMEEVIKLRTFTLEKLQSLNNFLKDIDSEVQYLEKAFTALMKDPEPNLAQGSFQKIFKKCCIDIKAHIYKVLTGQNDFLNSGPVPFEEAFRTELDKIKKKLLKSGVKARESIQTTRKEVGLLL